MKKIITTTGILALFLGSMTSSFAGYFNTTPIARCDSQITHTLQIGSENTDVYTLQQFLVRASYLYVSPNGYFGPSTKAAVKRFQMDNNLSTTGTVGESTRNAINERLCDTDLRADMISYESYGYGSTGVTYVDQYDPYARVISPLASTPLIYATPQASFTTPSAGVVYANNTFYPANSSYYPPVPTVNAVTSVVTPPIVPATTNSVLTTNIIYSPSIGYTYSVVPQPGTLTISTPLINAYYNEGDTVYMAWSTSNINANAFQILLENTSTGQSKQVSYTTSNNASFVLTKEVLDSVCAGACDNNQQGTFRFVITTPITDIAGITSAFRAAVSPVTIKRPYSPFTAVNISTSKTPVSSGEMFKLYVNTPSINPLNSWNASLYANMTVRIHAFCLNNVSVSIAGVPCGQDFTMPVSLLTSQSGVPVMITNPTFYGQTIMFEASIVDPVGNVLGTSRTNVTVNAIPLNW